MTEPLPAPALPRLANLDTPEVMELRRDLAASLRWAARLGLAEGICNHFSATLPGTDDLFLVNPYGWAFAEASASRLLVCDYAGRVVAGDGVPEPTAFFIHARLHLHVPSARVAMHTHMPHATALSMVDGPPLAWAGQTALKFFGRIAVDSDYGGLALDEAEGDRIAACLRDAQPPASVLFMRNHGVMIVGPSVAEAFDDLYYLERACEVQLLAQGSGRPLCPVPHEVALATARQMAGGDGESARLHLRSIRRRLDAQEPDYAL